MIRAEFPLGLRFTAMPADDELLRRALARTDEELVVELRRVVRDLCRRIREGGTPEQLWARKEELAAARRAYERLKHRIRVASRAP